MMKELEMARIVDRLIDEAVLIEKVRSGKMDNIALMVQDDRISIEESKKRMLSANQEAIEKTNDAKRLATWKLAMIADGQKIDGIKVDGYRGKWYVVDVRCVKRGTLLLLEHETYGDETGALIVTEKTHKVVLDDVWNGWSDYYDAFEA